VAKSVVTVVPLALPFLPNAHLLALLQKLAKQTSFLMMLLK
jgi:hypothetical protein